MLTLIDTNYIFSLCQQSYIRLFHPSLTNPEFLSSYWLCLTDCLVAEHNTSYMLFLNVISNNRVKARTGMKFNRMSSSNKSRCLQVLKQINKTNTKINNEKSLRSPLEKHTQILGSNHAFVYCLKSAP